ncbi:MAG TPA: polyphosphate kinase 2 family protein, partial [Nocardioides sp.]|nr:polyphosphate kinase 2 family protein [Nocardioides sp.]
MTDVVTAPGPLLQALRLPPGPVRLDEIPSDATPGFEGGKADGKRALAELGKELAELQERLFAEGT